MAWDDFVFDENGLVDVPQPKRLYSPDRVRERSLEGLFEEDDIALGITKPYKPKTSSKPRTAKPAESLEDDYQPTEGGIEEPLPLDEDLELKEPIFTEQDFVDLVESGVFGEPSSPLDDPEYDLIINGMPEEVVNKVRDDTHTAFTFINGGGTAGTPTLEESNKKLEGYQQLFSSHITPLNLSIANRQIRDQFMYERAPAFSVISHMGSTAAAYLGDALSKAEKEKFEWGQRAVNIATGIYAATQAIRVIRRIAQGIEVAKAGASARRGVAIALGAAAAPETGGISLAAALIYGAIEWAAFEVGTRVVQAIGENVAEGYVYQNAMKEYAANLFDKSRITGELNPSLGVLAGTPYSRYNAYNLFDEVRANGRFGINVSNLGYNYENISNIIGSVGGIAPLKDIGGLTTSVISSAGILGVDEKDVMGSYGALSRIAGADVDKVTEQFINFFGALSGDGKLLTSQLHLVDELASFSEQYGFGTKFNKNAAEEVAKLAGFFASTQIGAVQSTQPVIQTIGALDDILKSGASFGSRMSSDLLAISGISTEDAFHGLTGNAELLDSLLGGMRKQAGLGDRFFTGGKLNKEGYDRLIPYLIRGLNLSETLIQPIVVALEAKASGKAISQIQSAYEDAQRRAENYNSATVPKLLTSIGEQEVTLSQQVASMADHMMDVHDIIMQTISDAPKAVEITERFTANIKGLLGLRDWTPSQKMTYTPEFRTALSTAASNLPFFSGIATGVAGEILDNLFGTKQYEVPAVSVSGSGLTKELADAIFAAAKELGINPIDLLTIIGIESDFNTKAVNKDTGATGLIQWLPSTAADYGTSTDAIYNMSIKQQRDLLVRYFKAWGIKPGSDATALYLTVLFPAARFEDNNFVLMGRDGFIAKDGTFYGMKSLEQNWGLNLNKDDQLTRGEVDAIVQAKKRAYVNIDLIADFINGWDLLNAVENAIP